MADTAARVETADRRDRDAAMVHAFVRRHFTWPGTVRVHRASLGLDLLRAPINVALAPVFLLFRLTALVLTVARLERAGRWLASRRILLRSDASRAIERAVIDELLRHRSPPGDDNTAASERMVEDYVGIRNAVAEIVTTVLVLGTGLIAFRAATPGVLSLAPLVSDHAALNVAIASFPLGETLGRAWYGVFPVDLSGWFIAAVAGLLVVSASVVTTFAGLLADPVQAALGIHQRRLMRLFARIDAAGGTAHEIASEHVLARLADISDAAAALVRILRP
jgi:hypothetical protein